METILYYNCLLRDMTPLNEGTNLTHLVELHLGGLIRDILKRNGDPTTQRPYCIVIPYAFIINDKPVEHIHPVWIDAADSFEDAKRQAVDRFWERVHEGVREGFDPIVKVYYDKIHRYGHDDQSY